MRAFFSDGIYEKAFYVKSYTIVDRTVELINVFQNIKFNFSTHIEIVNQGKVKLIKC